MADELTVDERLILDIAQRHYRHQSSRDQAARDELGDMTATRYWQLLNALLDRPAALAYAPNYVKQMRAKRESRHGRQTAFQALLGD